MITTAEVTHIAHLARLKLMPDEVEKYAQNLSNICQLALEMNKIDTSHVQPLSHSLDMPARLREDVVTETDERTLMQSMAPQVEAGLYLVPQVIE